MARSLDDVVCLVCGSVPEPDEPDGHDDLTDRVVTVGGGEEVLLTRLDHGPRMLAIPLEGADSMAVVMRHKEHFDSVSRRAFHEVRNTDKYVCSGCSA